MKIETGIMVMKNGKGWGVIYEDGRETNYGWMAPEDAPIYPAGSLKNPTDVTYEGHSRNMAELATAELVSVMRRTEVELLD